MIHPKAVELDRLKSKDLAGWSGRDRTCDPPVWSWLAPVPRNVTHCRSRSIPRPDSELVHTRFLARNL